MDGSNRKRIYIGDVEETITPIIWGNVSDETIMNISSPRWSPDGTRIALVVDVAMDQSQLIVMDANGGNSKTASPDPQMVSGPDWSPDGTKIVYTMSTSVFGTFMEVFVTDLETDTWQQITHLSTQVGNLLFPRWSDDGKKIFFANSAHPDSIGNIYVYSFESDTVEIIGALQGIKSTLSRDGKWVFGYNDGSIFSYYITDQKEKVLTSGPNDQDPRLINSDTQLIFTRINNRDLSVWLMTVDGDDIHKVENSEEFIDANATDIFWK
jgi:TolB protein